jgi:tRNA dimethylallyltransferase
MLSGPLRRALVLTGPTASGKTRLGVDLALRLGAEIVSMDSMALYRGMDVGTAKPGPEERRQVPHHLIDVLDPWESASVAWWLERAADCCRDVERRGKRVLFVGGTPLYLKALLFGLFEGPPADPDLRRRLAAEAGGSPSLHERLARVDPETAARLHPNDLRRIIRALEVWELTSKPISAWQQQWRTPPPGCEGGETTCFWLDVPREQLYRRINERVREMVAKGLVGEVQALRRLERSISREARQALGYKEMFDHFDGLASLEETIVRIQQRSRNFAKRQVTWFRHLPGCRAVTPELTFAAWGLRMSDE